MYSIQNHQTSHNSYLGFKASKGSLKRVMDELQIAVEKQPIQRTVKEKELIKVWRDIIKKANHNLFGDNAPKTLTDFFA